MIPATAAVGKVQEMAKPVKHDPQWAKAKKLCRLNMEDIRMAKEVGLTPKSLVKNIPSPTQKWKLPVKLWIRELHEKRFGRRRLTHPVPPPSATPSSPANADADADVPF
jgi:hypothetical protein